jgi:Ni,Fe-hydrogenase III small subunit
MFTSRETAENATLRLHRLPQRHNILQSISNCETWGHFLNSSPYHSGTGGNVVLRADLEGCPPTKSAILQENKLAEFVG